MPIPMIDQRSGTRALTAALCQRLGLPFVQHPEGTLEGNVERLTAGSPARGEYDGRPLDLLDVARSCCHICGIEPPRNHPDLIRAAVSTSAFGAVAGNIVDRAVQAGYSSPNNIDGWTIPSDVASFREAERRVLSPGVLGHVERGGQAPAYAGDSASENYHAARYGAVFVADEQDLLDHDIGALWRIPEEMGRAARRLVEDLVFSVVLQNEALADGVPLFDAAHGNAATNALSLANLGVGIAAMADQRWDAQPLNVQAKHIIVAPALAVTAREILNKLELRNDPTTNLRLRVETRVGAGGLVNPTTKATHLGSATAWYLAGEPATIEVGYASGRRPQVREFQLKHGQWGLGWDISLDVGAKALDFRGLYRGNV